MKTKIALILSIILNLILFIGIYNVNKERVDMDVRMSNLKVCLDVVKNSPGSDNRHININTIQGCYDFYLFTPTETIINDYN